MNKDNDSLLVNLALIIIVGAIIGVLGGIAANGFVIGARYFFESVPVIEGGSLVTNFGIHWVVLIAGGLFIFGLKRFYKMPRWHGPADTILSSQVPNEPFHTNSGFVSTLAAFVSASVGSSVGQYGPVVHFGASVASAVRNLIPSRIHSEVYLGCGVAAAISAGFSAPIAGVIFASEAVLRHFSVRALAPLAVASITASATTKILFNRGSPYDITPINFTMHEVMPLLFLLAICSAFMAITFMSSLLKVIAWTGKQNKEFLMILVAATLMALIGTLVPEVFGLGTATINQFFANDFWLDYLVIILIAKLAASVCCLGMGLFGGVFSPAIFLGACLGTIVGLTASLFGYDSSIIPLMTTAGMACVASSVVGAPIAIVLIVFELTQSYQYAVAAIFSVAICSLVSTRIYCYSYFDRQLLLRGFNLKIGREYLILQKMSINQLDITSPFGFLLETSNQNIVNTLKDRGNTEAFIIDQNNVFLGVVKLTDALRHPTLNASDIIDRSPSILKTSYSLLQSMEVAKNFVGEAIPVVDEQNVLVGSLSEGDILGAVLNLQDEVKAYERN
jgi:CIC family chloride channel protein